MAGFMDALLKRRSRYAISPQSPISDGELEEMLQAILKNSPTAYNMQGTRAVLLLGESHKKLWDIVLTTLQSRVPADKFGRTRTKIEGFAAGHGTVLYFNDEAVTQQYMEENPRYAENFPGWALQQNGMLQVSVWMALAEKGLGASVQHYNPLIDDAVKKQWDLPDSWSLICQMPFGQPTAPPDEKEFMDIEQRFRLFT